MIQDTKTIHSDEMYAIVYMESDQASGVQVTSIFFWFQFENESLQIILYSIFS